MKNVLIVSKNARTYKSKAKDVIVFPYVGADELQNEIEMDLSFPKKISSVSTFLLDLEMLEGTGGLHFIMKNKADESKIISIK